MSSATNSLCTLVGNFTLSALQKNPQQYLIAQKLCYREELDLDEAFYLAQAPLPLLQKLSQIVIIQNQISKTIRMRPMLYIPLAFQLESKGYKGSLETSIKTLNSISLTQDIEGQRVQIAIDRWRGQFRTETLLNLISELINRSTIKVSALGPSTAEIQESLKRNTLGIEKDLNVYSFLDLLFKAGVRTIEGGGNFETHKIAAQIGYTLRVSQTVHSYSNLIKKILTLRKELLSTKILETWYPILPNENICNYLKCICIARILLPEVPYIRVPISLIDGSGVGTSVDYGANDYGYFAVNKETSNALELERLWESRDISPIQSSHNRIYERVSIS